MTYPMPPPAERDQILDMYGVPVDNRDEIVKVIEDLMGSVGCGFAYATRSLMMVMKTSQDALTSFEEHIDEINRMFEEGR